MISSRRATEMFQFTRCPPSLPMCSAGGLQTSLWRGCPIRNLRAQRLHAAPPERFAGLRVLLRPSAPRHPPRTLSSLFASCRFLHLALRWGCSLASPFALLCLEFVRVDVLCFSLACLLALGKIEVILFDCSGTCDDSPQQLKSGNQLRNTPARAPLTSPHLTSNQAQPAKHSCSTWDRCLRPRAQGAWRGQPTP